MEFLVNIEIAPVPGTRLDEMAHLRAAEADRAAELFISGNIVRLWRVPDQWANWGLWNARDQEHLELLLRSLPLWPFMTATVHPLEPHPSDRRGRFKDPR